MKRRLSLSIKSFVFIMLFFDMAFGVLFFNYENFLFVLIYSILSAAIYLFLFSVNRDSSIHDIKFYAILSLISIFVFTYVTFGPYFAFTGFVLFPTFLYALLSYIYVSIRKRYDQLSHVILINSFYLAIKVGLIFILILITALKGLGSV